MAPETIIATSDGFRQHKTPTLCRMYVLLLDRKISVSNIIILLLRLSHRPFQKSNDIRNMSALSLQDETLCLQERDFESKLKLEGWDGCGVRFRSGHFERTKSMNL